MNNLNLKSKEKPVHSFKIGFSFGVLFFGSITPFFKKDYKHAFIIFSTKLLLCILAYLFIKNQTALLITCSYILIMINILFAFNYNRLRLEDIIEKGFVPRDGLEGVKLLKKGIYFIPPR